MDRREINNRRQVPYTEVLFETDGLRFSKNDKELYELNKHRFRDLDEHQLNIMVRRLNGQAEPDHKSVIIIGENLDTNTIFNVPTDWQPGE